MMATISAPRWIIENEFPILPEQFCKCCEQHYYPQLMVEDLCVGCYEKGLNQE